MIAAVFWPSVADRSDRRRWIGWLLISLVGVAAGLRFFPRYYFQLLPVVVLMAARGFAAMLGRRARLVALLLLIPLARFAPTYFTAARDAAWRDTAMDRDSRAAAAIVDAAAKPGDTLFVWGYRPEIYVYSHLPAAIRFLDSQPLTGVPADRHLTQSDAGGNHGVASAPCGAVIVAPHVRGRWSGGIQSATWRLRSSATCAPGWRAIARWAAARAA